MSLRELQKRLDKIERRAKTKQLGILPIRTEIDLDAVENWDSLTVEERAEYRSRQPQPDVGSMFSTEPLAAIVVSVWLPDEDNLWRLSFQDTEPECEEPITVAPKPAEPTFRELRVAYERALRAERSREP